MSRNEHLPPGSTIGILGAGQLGRMLALAALRYGLKVHVFGPDGGEPAFEAAGHGTIAAYDDAAALNDFASRVDVVTYEFENVPADTARIVAGLKPLRPGPLALATTQDRLAEKEFLKGLDIETAPFAAIDTAHDLEAALARIGRSAILKTRRFGYDGKGQVKVSDGEPAAYLAELGHQPAILEGFVPFIREVSVVAARGLDGTFAAFDVCENVHRDHILHVTSVPAALGAASRSAAIGIAQKIAQALDYVGVIAVEMFVVGEGIEERIIVNEIAPRVHNSGHWTIEGAETSQFEQHIRAICGWPLGSPKTLGRVTMTNLIGHEVDAWRTLAAEPGAHLHLYGKSPARPGRKMGHVTRVKDPD